MRQYIFQMRMSKKAMMIAKKVRDIVTRKMNININYNDIIDN